MNVNDLTGPVIHGGVSWALAYLLKLNPVVTVFFGFLPDIVDKPLHAFGVGGGRYIGHSLLFGGLVTAAFYLWNRRLGLAALVGEASHLVLDTAGLVPWFYPFRSYDFSAGRFGFLDWLQGYVLSSTMSVELGIVAVLALAILVIPWLYRRYNARQGQR